MYDRVHHISKTICKCFSAFLVGLFIIITYYGFKSIISEFDTLKIPQEKVNTALQYTVIAFVIVSIALNIFVNSIINSIREYQFSIKRFLKLYPVICLIIFESVFLNIVYLDYNGPWKPFIIPVALLFVLFMTVLIVFSRISFETFVKLKIFLTSAITNK